MTSTLSSRMDPARSAQVRALLVDTVQRTTTQGQGTEPHQDQGARLARQRRRRVPRPIAFGAIAVGAVGLGTGAAVSVTQFLQPDGLSFTCVLGTDTDSAQIQKRATVADPIAACRREWPTAAEAPELAVFMDTYGSVFVAPAAWDGAGLEVSQVAEDVAFDPRPARLQAALDDWIDGLQSDCFSNDEAVARIEADLERLGLVGWSVRFEDNGGREEPADGIRTCARAHIRDGEEFVREVVLRGAVAERAPAVRRAEMNEAELRAYYTEQYRSSREAGLGNELSEQAWVEESIANTFAVRSQLRELRAAFPPGRCLTVNEAEQEVTRILDPSWNPVVDVSVDNTLACATVEVGMGGTWLVSIVGPAALPED